MVNEGPPLSVISLLYAGSHPCDSRGGVVGCMCCCIIASSIYTRLSGASAFTCITNCFAFTAYACHCSLLPFWGSPAQQGLSQVTSLVDGTSYQMGEAHGMTWQASGIFTKGCTSSVSHISNCYQLTLSSNPNDNLDPGNWTPRQRNEQHFPPQTDGSISGDTIWPPVFSTVDDGHLVTLDPIIKFGTYRATEDITTGVTWLLPSLGMRRRFLIIEGIGYWRQATSEAKNITGYNDIRRVPVREDHQAGNGISTSRGTKDDVERALFRFMIRALWVHNSPARCGLSLCWLGLGRLPRFAVPSGARQ
ncbi:hypothetical protein CALCODRAFT_506321 [Calocera cornea HHB12733]|uniref:Uncharacterized protein n=1 Tax=Calocera cornea HHB12733 TaxID=1353952 RepID=A0A165J3N7_9BASI|nr:hypothetical protein CALCODRAFT_506321 [Calocera cornea HHB12733]